ncbi:MAG: type II secretion system protein [Candidatus Omnitrophota bacterium]|nr:type II secretion system protein [Candidatus Omnitrophota bacterium]
MMRSNRGFTLLELMVVVAISSIIFYGIYLVTMVGDRQGQSLEVKMTVQDSARESLYRMIQEIRLSAPDRVDISVDGASIQFQVPDNDNPLAGNFAVDWDAAPTIEYALGGDNDDQIIRTVVGTLEERVVGNDVTSLEFVGDADNPNVVTITMQVQRQTVHGRLIPAAPLELTAQAEIRNT